MIDRCYNPNNPSYKNYGGRGITVDERWLGRPDGFWNFVADMGLPPAPNLTLDRIDNDGPYSPANCRWTTRRVQKLNSRCTVWVTIDGVTQCAADWARQIGVPKGSLKDRIKSRDGDHEAAIRSYATQPLGDQSYMRSAKTVILVTVDGVTRCVIDWARQLGIDSTTLARRARSRGGNYEAAIRSYVQKPRQYYPQKAVTVDGVTQYVADWARELGVSRAAIKYHAERLGGYEAAIRFYAARANDNLPSSPNEAA
jgi:hypothetical protein